VISGSYTKGLSFFKGLGNGKFAAAKPILTKSGKPLSEEYAQSPCLGDWDGDGDWDIVLGFIWGNVKLYRNNGDMTFSEGEELKCNGKPITARDGGPCIVDWDGDGILDLLLGDDSGSVMFYKGTAKGSLELTMDENAYVIQNKQNDAWQVRKQDPKSRYGFTPLKPGMRAKPFAADWNGDGKLDLLVGDFFSIERPAPKLTEKQKKELKALEEKLKEITKKQTSCIWRIQDKALKAIGKRGIEELSEEDQKKFQDAYLKLLKEDKEYNRLRSEYTKVFVSKEKLRPSPEYTGVVWVYLRK